MILPPLALSDSLNYIAVFLTMGCNLNRGYCINDPTQAGSRNKMFPLVSKSKRKEMTPGEWGAALNRIPFRDDLPLTLQGGEPTLYHGGKGIGEIIAQTPHHYDLLTNFALKPETFAESLNGRQYKFQRDAPYTSIRVSCHADEMNRTWKGRGFEELVNRCEALRAYGFDVSPVKAESDVGIYMVAHPSNKVTPEMEAIYAGRVPFETKEFLGVHDGKLYGTYKYQHSVDLVSSGVHSDTLACECRTSELLIDPLGFVWGCHYYLYESWANCGPEKEFQAFMERGYSFTPELFQGRPFTPLGHMLDPAFCAEDLREFHFCSHYGKCIGCDTKSKNNRFQSLDDGGVAHTSVEIRNIKWPSKLS